MGYARYTLSDGREAGYAVRATCDEPGCDIEINRGLAYLCGLEPGGGEHACGGYFCGGHLFHGGPHQQCERCADTYDDEHPEHL